MKTTSHFVMLRGERVLAKLEPARSRSIPKIPEDVFSAHADLGSSLRKCLCYDLCPCATAPSTNSGFISLPAGLARFMSGYLGERIMQHKIDSIDGFTKKYKVHRLVYYESYEHVMTAIGREKQLKGWRREKKIALIEKINPRWEDLAENWGREMRFRGQSLGVPSTRAGW